MDIIYWDKYDEDDFRIKKDNRNKKIDKRARAKEDFMKMNGRGLISDILPLIVKKGKEAKKGRK